MTFCSLDLMALAFPIPKIKKDLMALGSEFTGIDERGTGGGDE
jgi:hypothetical protein